MPNYKLTYFDVRGLAEPSRWIFAYTGTPYEDIRIPYGALTPEKKAELGLDWGQLPILEVDGRKFAQSRAFTRHLARKFNLTGKDEFEELKCDEMVDAIGDYTNLWSAIFRETDLKKQKKLIEHVVNVETPIYLTRYNDVLKRNGTKWSVGNQFTWADIYFSHYFCHFQTSFDIDLGLKNYPALHELIENVQGLPGIKEWIAQRPKTKW